MAKDLNGPIEPEKKKEYSPRRDRFRQAANGDFVWNDDSGPGGGSQFIEMLSAMLNGDWGTFHMHADMLRGSDTPEYIDPIERAGAKNPVPSEALLKEFADKAAQKSPTALLDRLAAIGGTGGAYDGVGPQVTNPDLTGLKIAEVIALAENDPGITGLGRYGLSPETLKALVAEIPTIDEKTVFDAKTQDAIVTHVLEKSGLSELSAGKITPEEFSAKLDTFMQNFMKDEETHNAASITAATAAAKLPTPTG